MSWIKGAALVREWRELTGVSQSELARRTGASLSTVARLEGGNDEDPPNTKPSTLLAIAVEMGEPRGSELLQQLGLESRLDLYELELQRRSLPSADRRSRFRREDELTPEQRAEVERYIAFLIEREPDG